VHTGRGMSTQVAYILLETLGSSHFHGVWMLRKSFGRTQYRWVGDLMSVTREAIIWEVFFSLPSILRAVR